MATQPSDNNDEVIEMQQFVPDRDEAAFHSTSLLSVLHCPKLSVLACKREVDRNPPKGKK